jgi:hypothetical protein
LLYIDQQKHIKGRADFFRTLAAAIQSSNDLLRVAPDDGRIMSVIQQLEMIRTWTDNGREPAKEERWQPQIGRILAREFDTEGDRRVIDWAELCGEVAHTFVIGWTMRPIAPSTRMMYLISRKTKTT